MPDNYAVPPSSTERARLDHHLAVRAAAAWNARRAIRTGAEPVVIVADSFGNGIPDHGLFAFTGGEGDFATQNPSEHGYLVLSIIAGTFGGPATAAGQVTGIFPATTRLRIVDKKAAPTGGSVDIPTVSNRIIDRVRETAGPAVVNTSLHNCAVTCGSGANAARAALAWIEKVRGAGVESRLLHAAAAGNLSNSQLSHTADTTSPWTAAALLPGLVDGGQSVPNLTNTLVVENVIKTATEPFAPLCLNADAVSGGNIGAVGTDVFVLMGPTGPAAELLDGGSSSSSPQAAGLAAYLWAIEPSLTAPALAALVRTTARADVGAGGSPRCNPTVAPAPVIDAYAAVLALDAATLPDPIGAPVRGAILDLDDDGRFDEDDLAEFIEVLADDPPDPAAPDYGRHDLNGDGFTGGSQRTARFDLDRIDSVQFGASGHGVVLQPIAGFDVPFDEEQLTDPDILCYYAYSDLFEGSAATRDAALPLARCVRARVDATFPAEVAPEAASPLAVRVATRRPDGTELAPLAGVHVELVASGGTVETATGLTDAQGRFQTTATAGPGVGSIAIQVVVRSAPDGDMLAETSVEASVSTSTVDCTPSGDSVSLLLNVTGVGTEQQFGEVGETLTDSLELADRRVAAEVSMGFGHVTAELQEGAFSRGETAGALTDFQDLVVVTPGDPALIGAGGTLTARVEVTASGNATGDHGFAGWRLHIVPQQVERTGRFTAAGYTGDSPGIYDIPLGIAFGQPMFVKFNFNGNASAASPTGGGSRGGAQIDVTVRFLGYIEARDAGGTPVPFSICTNIPPPTTSSSTITTSSTTTTVTTTTTSTTLSGAARDPYRTYDATGPDGPSVKLADELRTEIVDLGSVLFFLTPSGIDGAPFHSETITQACYGHPGTPFAGTAEVVSRLGAQTVAVGNPVALCVPSEASGISVDAYACHAATGDPLAQAHTLADAFQTQPVDVLEPFLFCLPASVDGSIIVNALEYFTCYVTVPAGAVVGPVAITNAFHSDTLDVGMPVALCVPSLAALEPTGS